MNQWFLIVNPASGKGKAKNAWPKIQQLLQQYNIQYDYKFTERSGHATALTKDAIAEGYRKIISVGGDGTNNEIINGICRQDIVKTHEITFAVIPIGTGNDWIRTHKIPNDIEKTIALIQKGKTKTQDIGIANCDRSGKAVRYYFINVAGLAYDGYIGKVTTENRNLVNGKLSYLWLILKCLFQYEPQPARIHIDKKVVHETCYTIALGVCKYNGGGMQFVPHAVPDDGLFAVTIAKKLSKLEVILATPYFYNGRAAEHSKIDTYEAKEVVIVHKDTPLHLEIDGEYIGETPASFSLINNGLTFIA